jgi:NAD(P)-dependent dehydrogenase (short-subunit alcohol dehydrogenase family)
MEKMDKKQQYAIYPSLHARKVLVTGGATGIGEAFVTGFAEQGAQVAFLDIQDEAAATLSARIAANGHPTPLYLHCDMTDLDAVRTSVKCRASTSSSTTPATISATASRK